MNSLKSAALSTLLRCCDAVLNKVSVKLDPIDGRIPMPPIVKYFYVKRFKLITDDEHGFLQGSWISSHEFSAEEVLNKFPIQESTLNGIERSFTAATAQKEWLEIIPLKCLRVIK